MRSGRVARSLTVSLAGLLLAVAAAAPGQSRSQAESLLREAEKAMRTEDLSAAERLYQAAATADPQSPEASCGLGQVLLALQRYEEAVPALERCKRDILTNLKDLQAQQARAWAEIDREIREVEESLQAIRSGRNRSAGPDSELRLEGRIRELQQMKARDPIRVEVPTRVSFALGSAYLSVGLPEKAEWEFVAVLRSDPGSGDAHNNLAAVYLALGRFGEASEHARLAEEAGVRVSPQMKADIVSRYSPGAPSTTPGKADVSSPPEGESLSIAHEGRTCAVNGRFVPVKATVTPSWGVHEPTLHFRTEEARGWYSTFMLPVGQDDFATLLPKVKSARSFTYYIEVKTYEDETSRTPDYQVAVVSDETACPEAAADPAEAGALLIVDKPNEDADAPPVPRGFSIRGTTADAGVLEVGQNKALLYGGLGLAGGIAAGVAVATQGGGAYSGPQPFSEFPGISLVAIDPPSGSTLSLSGGQILVVQLNVFSIEAMPGAQIVADVGNFGSGTYCIQLNTTQDLPVGRTTTVVLNGPTVRAGGGSCDTRRTLDRLRVIVTRANGLGGFQTGQPPLGDLHINFKLVE